MVLVAIDDGYLHGLETDSFEGSLLAAIVPVGGFSQFHIIIY